MPVIIDGRAERRITAHEAERLLRPGVLHMPDPFDRAALGLCPERSWEEVERVLSSHGNSD